MVESAPVTGSADVETHVADAELVARARSGERMALAEIYRTHRAPLGRHLLLLTHDAAAVDDLVQDVFLTAFAQLERYTGRCRLGTWLHGIGLNVARNHRRKRRRRQGLLHRIFAPQQAERTAEGSDQQTREREALDALHAELDRLPVAQREAFVVRVLQQVPLADAADMLDAPIATVSYRTRQAEAKVRAALQSRGYPS